MEMCFRSPAPTDKSTGIITATTITVTITRRPCPGPTPDTGLFQRINRQATQQFWIEIRRLLRQYLIRERDVPHLLHVYRVHEERHIRLATAHLCQRIARLTHVANILLVANRLLRDYKHSLQQALVLLHHHERFLPQS